MIAFLSATAVPLSNLLAAIAKILCVSTLIHYIVTKRPSFVDLKSTRRNRYGLGYTGA